MIELILVMALLAIVVSVAFPSLQGFFRGRNLDSEARRFLSLTRYGQSRAVSEGVPMVLWIDAQEGTYGLQAQAGYMDLDRKAVEFELDKELRIEVQTPVVIRQSSSTQQTQPGVGNVPKIQFLPDGFIAETSPESILFRQDPAGAVRITQSSSRLNYEIEPDYSPNARR